jgi:hypothetical protein
MTNPIKLRTLCVAFALGFAPTALAVGQDDVAPPPTDEPSVDDKTHAFGGQSYDITLESGCRWFQTADTISGILDLAPASDPEAPIDFGEARVELTENTADDPFVATGSWYALDFGFLSLWLVGASSDSAAMLAYGLSMDGQLYGSACRWGQGSGRYRLQGTAPSTAEPPEDNSNDNENNEEEGDDIDDDGGNDEDIVNDDVNDDVQPDGNSAIQENDTQGRRR